MDRSDEIVKPVMAAQTDHEVSILVAINRGERSAAALRRALTVSAGRPAMVRVMTIEDPDCSADELEAAARKVQDTAAAAVTAMSAPAGTVSVTASARRFPEYIVGDEAGRAGALDAAARDRAADYIVIGRHDQTARAKPFAGTLTARLLGARGCPVLVVAGDGRGEPLPGYQHVMIPIDFSASTPRLLELAVAIAPGARITLVHAVSDDNDGIFTDPDARARKKSEAKTALAQIAADLPHATVRVVEGTPKSVLRQTIAAEAPDLVVLGTLGRSAMAKALLGSVAQDLIDHPLCDTLAVRGR